MLHIATSLFSTFYKIKFMTKYGDQIWLPHWGSLVKYLIKLGSNVQSATLQACLRGDSHIGSLKIDFFNENRYFFMWRMCCPYFEFWTVKKCSGVSLQPYTNVKMIRTGSPDEPNRYAKPAKRLFQAFALSKSFTLSTVGIISIMFFKIE